MIERQDLDTIAVLRLAHGKVSAMDAEFLQAIIAAFDAAADADAIVLTGTGSSFSAGVDLFRILDGKDAYVDRFLPLLSRAFLRVFTHPRPVVAAVNGHAIAGGCILACACDWRLMAAGSGRVGVPELRVGVPFPLAALEIVRFAAGGATLQTLVYGGATLDAEAARQHGLVDEVLPPDALLDRAVAVARQLAAAPHAAFALTKQTLRAPTLERIGRRGPDADGAVAAAWRSPECHAAIRAYLDRTLGKRSAG
jgi:enoyl-CoA hydratase